MLMAFVNGDIVASFIPRQATLASLKSITDGGGELALATDSDTVVILRNGTPVEMAAFPAASRKLPASIGGGPGYNFPSLIASLIEADGNMIIAPLYRADGTGSGVYVAGGEDTYVGSAGNGGELSLKGGNSSNGAGGELYIGGGAGPAGNGMAILITPDGAVMAFHSVGGVPRVGFFDATPTAKPAVTGSRASGAALASLLTALANLGLITNSSAA